MANYNRDPLRLNYDLLRGATEIAPDCIHEQALREITAMLGCRECHGPPEEEHDCPYNEIEGSIVCNCCDYCANVCAMDI